MAQSVEHVIGNDEVISSILITSSKKMKHSNRGASFFIQADEGGLAWHPCAGVKCKGESGEKMKRTGGNMNVRK